MGELLQVSCLCTCSVTGFKELNLEAGSLESGGIWITKICSLRWVTVSVGKLHLATHPWSRNKESGERGILRGLSVF